MKRPSHLWFLLIIGALSAGVACKKEKKAEESSPPEAETALEEVNKQAKGREDRGAMSPSAPDVISPVPPPQLPKVPAQEGQGTVQKEPETSKPQQNLEPVAKQPEPGSSQLPLDPRLLLTVADITEATKGKAEFTRTILPGIPEGPNKASVYYEPTKSQKYGFGLQIFREADPRSAQQRFDNMFASYPNAVEVAPIAGKTFFAYWDEVLFVVFLQPRQNLVLVVSCGRSFCDSDGLYALAKKVNSRIK